ncbi:GtrA family protein [Planobispora rosea]|nr:GtrA family protein [Planobispora rosea]
MTGVDTRSIPRTRPVPRRRTLPSVLRGHRTTYLVGGVMTMMLYLSFLALALPIFESSVPYIVLVAISHLLALVIVYPWYRLVVFRVSEGSWTSGFLRFYLVSSSFLAVSVIGLPILVEIMGVSVLAAQSLVIPMSTVLAYLINRSWTFRDHGSVKRW